jgi:hypothetical protein
MPLYTCQFHARMVSRYLVYLQQCGEAGGDGVRAAGAASVAQAVQPLPRTGGCLKIACN